MSENNLIDIHSKSIKSSLSKVRRKNPSGPLVNAGKSLEKTSGNIQWLLIGLYSLSCFLFGIVITPYLEKSLNQKRNSSNEKVVKFLKAQNRKIKNSTTLLNEIQGNVMRLEQQVSASMEATENIEYELKNISFQKHALGIRKPSSIADERKQLRNFEPNIDRKYEDELAVKHFKLLEKMKSDHQKRREMFLKKNEIVTAEGLKAWEEFSKDLLNEKRRLTRIINNEKKTFKPR